MIDRPNSDIDRDCLGYVVYCSNEIRSMIVNWVIISMLTY